MADRVEVDLIVKAIAEGFEQVKKQQSEITDEAKKQPGVLSKLKDNWLQVGIAVSGALVALQSVKKIWDFAQEGAQIRQTAESFDYLTAKLGITTDLLGDLKRAARGTVDDMTLMSATETLLAGTGDDLGKQLAMATPQLLEIAKAANKLNPSLGDVAYQYQSIATGIKRASPLILDNLGLTIKIGQANEAYASSIGKTSAQLTAEEKQLALLQAALKAGDKLIAQVGGTTESASDSFQRLAAEQKNAWDRMKAGLSEALEPMAAALADNLEEANAFARATRALGLDLDATNLGLQRQGEVAGMTRDEIIQTGNRIVDLAQGYQVMAEEAKKAGDQSKYFVTEIEDTPKQVDVQINLSIPSDAESFIQQSLFKGAGGEALSIAIGKVTGPQGEALDESVRRQFAAQAIAIDAAIKIDAGLLDTTEAKKQVSDALGITPEEAQTLIDPYIGQGKKAAEQLGKDVNAALGQAHQDLQDSGAFQELFSKPVRDVQQIKQGLDRLEERTVTVYIQYKTIGQPPTERASGGPLEGLTLVGERGPELIMNGVVVDAATTRRLMSLGITPGQRRAVAGPIDGGTSNYVPGGGGGGNTGGGGTKDKELPGKTPGGYDPGDTTQKSQVGGTGSSTSAGGTSSTSTGGTSTAGVDSSIKQTVDEIVTSVNQTVASTVAATVKPIVTAQISQLANQAARAERQAEERARILRDISVGVRRLLTPDDARTAFREGAQSINREL